MRPLVSALLALTLAFTIAPATESGGERHSAAGRTAVAAPSIPSTPSDAAAAIDASRDFLTSYVLDDGRVVRWDQGGDTVSEGQGYAMLIAAAIGDEVTFDRVWRWTERELLRDDGLFAWHWNDGAVVDEQSASDADLFIAAALSLAGRKFAEPRYTDAALRTSDALLELAAAEIGGRRVLTAGPWAVDDGVVNPSYWAVPLMSRLWWDGAWGWASVAANARESLEQLTSQAPHLPPDWAVADESADGELTVDAIGLPPVHGWEAVRVPIQAAVDCAADGKRIAARLWPFHLSRDIRAAAVVGLDGTVVDAASHPIATVAAAAAASAAGSEASARVLLDRAAAQDAEQPSYYGSAWIALGRLWLTTPLLGGCAQP